MLLKILTNEAFIREGEGESWRNGTSIQFSICGGLLLLSDIESPRDA